MFQNPALDNHELVAFANDEASGLQAIVAIHNTARGPALGGCRVWTYEDDTAALTDALRLSRGMTFKAAMADLPLGGGKSVVMVPHRAAKTRAMFEALGRTVHSLSGRYIVAEDVGSSPDDMAAIRLETEHVTGLLPEHGGVGDPSPTTALGGFIALRATAAALGRDLCGLHVAVQGLGNVGYGLAQRLCEAGARLTVADIHRDAVDRAVNELGATAVSPDQIVEVEADIFSPNALGAVLNARTIPSLKVAAVAGCANNQLETPEDGKRLNTRGILYAPDYVVNAGGLVKMCSEYYSWDQDEVDRRVDAIGERLFEVFRLADEEDAPTDQVADAMAKARISPAATAIEPLLSPH
ncbi:MAG: Glu/Leu/Phe/Val dehydrogenase dimerization domain-containing protein [Pseudomonadota bacterium]